MSVLKFSDRSLEIASRWSEVHVKRIMRRLEEDHGHPVDRDFEYLYEDDLFQVSIQLVPRCLYNEKWVRCNVKHCDQTVWMPRVLMISEAYPDDVFFCLEVPNDLSLPHIYEAFEKQKVEKKLCACGRIPQENHLLTNEPKCNHCYIYGFVSGESCSICMEDDGKPWIKTSCGHCFHNICWDKIIPTEHGSRKCPLCRSHQQRGTIVQL